jgi:7-cyano-7-deazaguanine synthase in queuosine biosynthesis
LNQQQQQREPLIVRPLPVTTDAGRQRHKVLLRFPPHLEHPHQTFYFELQGDRLPPAPDRQDALVLAMVFFAMQKSTDLHVEGRVSRDLLSNLEEFQRAWALWHPERYRPVRISCSEELDAEAPHGHRGVIALSGGVDSVFALLQHTGASQARDRCDLVASMLVHGFDLRLESSDAFEAARSNAAKIAEQAGLALTVVRTDWRDRVSLAWEDDHIGGLAACLALFSGVADCGLVGLDEDYAHLVVPWGSNAVTNPMLSSGRFRIVSVGGACGRTAKVAAIAEAGDLAGYLRVCWKDQETGSNCGHCEKCIRTKLNFIVAGRPLPTSLGPAPGLMEVLRLRASAPISLSFVADIRDASRGSAVELPMRLAIAACLLKNQLLLPLRNPRRKLRRLFKRLRANVVRMPASSS